jgi:hypothetical protein
VLGSLAIVEESGGTEHWRNQSRGKGKFSEERVNAEVGGGGTVRNRCFGQSEAERRNVDRSNITYFFALQKDIPPFHSQSPRGSTILQRGRISIKPTKRQPLGDKNAQQGAVLAQC